MRKNDIPKGGLLEGLRVVYSGTSVAAPYCGALMADMGADVIWIEAPNVVDVTRTWTGVGYTSEVDRRNQRDFSLNIVKPEGRQVFLNLMKETDIFIEASRGGQFDRMGLSDEVLWEQNPKLVIGHLSGFGQTGPYASRASFDPTAQAFSGFMWMNSIPGKKPFPPNSSIADYYSAYLMSVTSLAAYMKAQRTGVGESIDLAQYEAVMRTVTSYGMEGWNMDPPTDPRDDKHNFGVAGFDSYECKDGIMLYVMFLGVGVCKNGAKVLGIEYGSELMPEGVNRLNVWDANGIELDRKITQFCAERTAEEAEKAFLAGGVPCCRIFSFSQCKENEHVKARETLTSWKTVRGQEVTGCNLLPHIKNHRYQIWRGCPDKGQDNDDILLDLGYDAEQIKTFYDNGIIVFPEKKAPMLPHIDSQGVGRKPVPRIKK